MASSASDRPSSGFPLGLASLGISVTIWSAFLGGWLTDPQPVALVTLFTGGIGMLAAGIIAFRENVPFGGSFYIAMSTFWASAGFYYWFFAGSMKDVTADVAWVFAVWVIFVGIATLGTLRMKSPLITLGSVLFFLELLLVWIWGAFHAGMIVLQIGAISGILSAIVGAILFYQVMMREAA